MECLIGIQFDNFILLACDGNAGRSIISMKKDEDKIYGLSDKLALAICGESGSAVRFAEFISQNVQLYKMTNGYDMTPDAAAHFTRRQLADSVRTSGAFNVNLLLGGMNKSNEPKLFFMDHLGSLVQVPFAIHGYGSYMTLSILDRKYDPAMTKEEGLKLLQECIREIQMRFVYNLSTFKVKIIDAEGITSLADIHIDG